MIYVNNKLKYLFDFVPTAINEEGVELGKLIYSAHHEDEIKNIPYDEWNIIHKNGECRDYRSDNLELVVFVND